jgi:two-component system NtrC family sensor kinase
VRLRTLLILGTAAAALPPLLLLGFAATEEATKAITGRVVALHAQQADNLAGYADTWISGRTHAVSLLREAFPIEDLSSEGQVGFERLVYNQIPEVNIVSLVTPQGIDVAPSQMVRPDAPVPPGHEAVDIDRFRAFRGNLPLAGLEEGRIAIGPPYLPPGADHPVAPVAFAGVGEGAPVLAVELSLEPLLHRMELIAEPPTEVAMLDALGRPFASSGGELVEPSHFLWFLDGVPSAELKYQTAHGDVLASFARVESTGWLAVVAEPYAQATAPGRDIRWRASWFGLVAIALASVLGLNFARKIHRPVVQLRDAARAVGEGSLGRQVEPDSIGELGELGHAFNTMSEQLARDAARIKAQQDEIQAFNLELQQRVEERTRELEQAQDKLVESSRLAAVAELGAGLAHELNNPLAGILGLTQLLAHRREGTSDAALLGTIEEQVKRCTDIVAALLAFTREGVVRGELDELDLDEIISDVTALVRPAFETRSLELRHQPAEVPLRVRADRASLGQALAQLISSLRALLAPGGELSIHGVEEGMEIWVELRLHSINAEIHDTSRDDWFASGMSLWVARRILAEHGGRLREPDGTRGTTYLLALPKA